MKHRLALGCVSQNLNYSKERVEKFTTNMAPSETQQFAEVIPVRRTPFGIDRFDYALPNTSDYQIGQLVSVPLRGHATEALIQHMKKTSPYAKQVKAVHGPLAFAETFPPATLELLSWVAERTFSSLPTVLHAWLGDLPKRFPQIDGQATTLVKKSADKQGQASAHWQVDHEQALLLRAKQALNDGQRVLILTPWTNRITSFMEALSTALPLHGDLASGSYFKHWSAFLTGQTNCLVATRMGAWLSSIADLVLIDEPENDDHKQDEQAPRYDARRIASWSAKYAGTIVEAFGLTPPLHAGAIAPDINANLIVNVFHPKGRSAIPCLQADSLLTIHEEADRPITIIHPIRGRAARLTCRDCGWQAPCEHCGAPLSANDDMAICRNCGKKQALPLSCPHCGSVDLGKAMPGIETLKKAWAKSEPTLSVDWRDTTNEHLERPFAQRALVVVTLSQLFGGLAEDIRHTERRLIAFRRLLNRVRAIDGLLIIQSNEQDLALWEAWKTGAGVQATYTTELTTRQVFRYPPTWRRVKCLIDGNEATVSSWIAHAKLRLAGQGEVESPSKISFRRPGSSERYIVHLLFSPEVSEAQLVTLLNPLAKGALIDLDPIAFFK